MTPSRPIALFAWLLVAAASVSVHAQTRPQFPGWKAAEIALSREAADLRFDSVSMPMATSSFAGKKSPVLAGFLSLAVPGLGEYYVGDQVWRGAIFTGIEIGAWIERAHWTARGDDSTAAFRAFGDNHWSTSNYAKYLDQLLKSRGFDSVAHGGDGASINRAEAILDSLRFTDFTHRLTFNDQQQYYELISKYIQYRPGWDDFTAIDVQSPNNIRHADMRANMNDQYGVATFFLYGIIVNHVLSAIDAALLARDHNSNLRLQVELRNRPLPDGSMGYIPSADFTFTF